MCFLLLFSKSSVTLVQAYDIRFESLTIADGLPSQSVYETYQQRNGFIWFATDRGAIRYDGKSFRSYMYSPGAPNHITNNFALQTLEDHIGNIWIVTEYGLNKLSANGSIQHYLNDPQKPDSINSNWIHFIYQDSSHRIWVGTNEGLNLYQAETNNFLRIKGQQKDSSNNIAVFQMLEIEQDTLMLGTLDGIAFFKPTEQMFVLESDRRPDLPSWYKSTIYKLAMSKTGRILIGTDNEGLIDFDPQTNEYYQYKTASDGSGLSSNNINAIVEDANGKLVLSHYGAGLTLISPDRQTFTQLKARDFDDTSLISDEVNHVFIDQSGLLWVSTMYGISKYSYLQNGSTIIRKQADGKGLSGMVASNTAVVDDDNLLVATSGGLNKLRISDGRVEKIELLPPEQGKQANLRINDIHKDSKGNFWIVSPQGLHKYNPLTNERANYYNNEGNEWGFTGNELFTVLVAENDEIWVTGFVGVALAKFTPGKGITERLLADPLHIYTRGGNYTTDALLSKKGDIWLSTTDGVYRINPQLGLEQHIRLGPNNRENIRISSLVEDENGAIWAATQGVGLAKMTVGEDNNVISTLYSTDDGLLSNELLTVSIFQDNLWLSTKDQLFTFDTVKKESKAYPSLFNLPGLIFESAAQTLVGDNLFLGSNKGLVIIKLTQIQSNEYNSPVQITQAKADEVALIQGIDASQQSQHYIDYQNNNLSFSFAALDFTNPSAIRYRYYLEGFEGTWVDAGNKTNITYNSLQPGVYTFKVTASNSDGKWSNEVAKFTFEIEQPWWFYTLWSLAALLAFALALFILNRRIHVKLLYKKANYDSLTGIANRYHFNNSIEELVSEPDNLFSLLIVDLDGFKEVNDVYGHAVGDELLIQAAARMKKVLRDDDLLARLGGDEFAIIINKHNQLNRLLNITERLRQALQSPYKLTSHMVTVSASIGAASFPADTKSKESLLIYADTAMFAAKQSGKNTVKFFNEELSAELEKRTELKQKLQAAIINEEFVMHYQPQVDQFTKKVVGFEALIRWFQGDGTTIPPNVFIPEAERNGSIVEIGQWALLSSCMQAAEWEQNGLEFGKVSVNVSAVQITKSSLVNDVEQALKQSNLSPKYLELEMTESVLVDNVDMALDTLSQLRELGITIALDDFGTGYSSLNYLTKFPIDTLKIDRSFIKSVEVDTATKMVLKNIYTLAADLSMKVVAEGIETEEQLKILASLQGRIIQGYYYSPALAPLDAVKLLQTRPFSRN
ncbi:MAG: diguanylate cyclase (GGDEF)-like protein [Glaciecola sp.]|jgi:diguanylate cyclase (GGDEF)-like protein